MRVKVSNNIDDDRSEFEIKTDYYNQRVADVRLHNYIYEVANRYWDKDIRFTILIERNYEESDIFTCNPQQYNY